MYPEPRLVGPIIKCPNCKHEIRELTLNEKRKVGTLLIDKSWVDWNFKGKEHKNTFIYCDECGYLEHLFWISGNEAVYNKVKEKIERMNVP